MAKQKDKLTREEERIARVQDYKEVFGTDSGREVLKDLAMFSQAFESLIVDPLKEIDPKYLVYREGQRSWLVYILEVLNEDPVKFMQELIEERDSY